MFDVFLKCFFLKWYDIIRVVSDLFPSSMRFHSAMATLESQKYVIARTGRTENILLVSGRLVFILYTMVSTSKLVHCADDTFDRNEEVLQKNIIFACQGTILTLTKGAVALRCFSCTVKKTSSRKN